MKLLVFAKRRHVGRFSVVPDCSICPTLQTLIKAVEKVQDQGLQRFPHLELIIRFLDAL